MMSITRGSDVPQLTIRRARAGDDEALAQLAERDSAEVPEGSLLVGEVGGELRAAVAVESGRTIADPFWPTADLVALLHARADQIRRARRRPLRVIARTSETLRPRPA